MQRTLKMDEFLNSKVSAMAHHCLALYRLVQKMSQLVFVGISSNLH